MNTSKLDDLILLAAGLNTSYRGVEEDERDLEIGFLYGTAEMVLGLVGLPPHESYSDRREEIARFIDIAAVKDGAPYRLTKDN